MKKYTCQQYLLLNKEGILKKTFMKMIFQMSGQKYFGLKGANFIIGVSVSYELYFLEY